MAKWKQHVTAATNRANWEVTEVLEPWWQQQPCLSQPGPQVSPCLIRLHRVIVLLLQPCPPQAGTLLQPIPREMPGAGTAPVLLSTSTCMEVPWLDHPENQRESQNVFTGHSYEPLQGCVLHLLPYVCSIISCFAFEISSFPKWYSCVRLISMHLSIKMLAISV